MQYDWESDIIIVLVTLLPHSHIKTTMIVAISNHCGYLHELMLKFLSVLNGCSQNNSSICYTLGLQGPTFIVHLLRGHDSLNINMQRLCLQHHQMYVDQANMPLNMFCLIVLCVERLKRHDTGPLLIFAVILVTSTRSLVYWTCVLAVYWATFHLLCYSNNSTFVPLLVFTVIPVMSTRNLVYWTQIWAE